MCPFCVGAAAWAVVGAVSAGGLGMLAAVVHRDRRSDRAENSASMEVHERIDPARSDHANPRRGR